MRRSVQLKLMIVMKGTLFVKQNTQADDRKRAIGIGQEQLERTCYGSRILPRMWNVLALLV